MPEPVDEKRFEQFEKQVLCAIDELKASFRDNTKSNDTRIRRLENSEAAQAHMFTSLAADVAKHETKIDTIEKIIEELRGLIKETRATLKNWNWVGGVVGGAAILWIVNQLLGLIK